MSSSIVEINRETFCWLNDLVVYFRNFVVAEILEIRVIPAVWLEKYSSMAD